MAACASELATGGAEQCDTVIASLTPSDTDVVMTDAALASTSAPTTATAVLPGDAGAACMPMPSASLLHAFRDGRDMTTEATMREPVNSRLFPCPILKVLQMYTSADGRTRLLIRVSCGSNIYEVSGHCVDADGVSFKRVPLHLDYLQAADAGDERFLIAEYPAGQLPVLPSCRNRLCFRWSAIADTPTFENGQCDFTRLPSIVGYAASGYALKPPSYWEETCDECDAEPMQRTEFTLLLRGMDHASIDASQISLVPVPDAATPTAAAAERPAFSVLSIAKASTMSPIKCATAFTVTCLRTARHVSSMFHVCINGVALGAPPLCVNQVEPARVRARHCLTADAYMVHLAGVTADGRPLEMFPWLDLLQSLLEYTVAEIWDDGSVVVSFSRSEIERVLLAAGTSRVLFMCGPTCIWMLDNRVACTEWAQWAKVLSELTPVIPYAPAEWAVSSLKSATASGSSIAGVQVFGQDGMPILPECCVFTGLIHGGLRKGASPLEPGLSISASPTTYFQLVDGQNQIRNVLRHGDNVLVQRESAEIAKLSWVHKAFFITAIKPTFVCFTIKATTPKQQSPFHEHEEMVFDNAERISENTYIMPIQPNQLRTYTLCMRGVLIKTLVKEGEGIIS